MSSLSFGQMRFHRLSGVAAALLWAAVGHARSISPALPFSERAITGHLANGLSYLIQTNREPRNRAELRLLVEAGSLHEEDHERGIAHFVEHMAFKKTRHFDDGEIQDFIEDLGMARGRHLNASTSYEYTLYNLTVPTDKKRPLRQALRLLADFASGVTLEAAALADERAVILEEQRARRGPGKRISDRIRAILWEGSRYLAREPIGQTEIVATATKELLEGFYRRWYVPERMTVIAVGDFDARFIERQIERRFGGIAPRHSPSTPVARIAGGRDRFVHTVTDPEQRTSSISMSFVGSPLSLATEESLEMLYERRLAAAMLSLRLDERGFEAEPPFLGGAARYSRRIDHARILGLSASIRDDGFATGLSALQTELLRAVRHGFTAQELERQKEGRLARLARLVEEQGTAPHRTIVQKMIGHVLNGDPLMDPSQTLSVATRAYASISTDDVTRALADMAATDRYIVYVTSERNIDGPPNVATTRQVLDEAAGKPLASYSEQVSTKPWLSEQPNPGTIVAERHEPDLDVYEWRLSNGTTVFVKPTDFKENEVLFRATRDGGFSNAEDDEYISAVQASGLVNRTGFGGFDLLEMNKRLAGSNIRLGSTIGRYTDQASGRTTWDEIGEFLQLAYLMFTEPDIDDAAMAASRRFLTEGLEKRALDARTRFADEVTKAKFDDHFRLRPWDARQIASLDRDAALAHYRKGFANAFGFKFAFVGNVEIAELRPLVVRYLGSLPSNPSEPRRFVDRKIRRISGAHQLVRAYGTEPRAWVRLNLTGSTTAWNSRESHLIDAVEELLAKRLTESLRDDEQKVYSVRATIRQRRRPQLGVETDVTFYTQVGNETEVMQMVEDTIDDIRTRGFTRDEYLYIRDQQRRDLEIALRSNRAWRDALLEYDDNEALYDWVKNYARHAEAISRAELARAAKRLLGSESTFKTVLLPGDGVREPEGRSP